MGDLIQDVLLTSLAIIPVEDGDVLHGMKSTDTGCHGFGEAYFSTIKTGHIKAWKRHRLMTMNLIVPVGEIRFVLYDDRERSKTRATFSEICLSRTNYNRLTIPSGIWVGFQGLSNGLNILLNIADMTHDPEETDNLDLNEIQYDWSINK